MRIALFIDSLTSGGAQRQLCWLARLLQEAGASVQILVYYPHDFFRPHLEDDLGILVHQIEWNSQLDRFRKVRRYMKAQKPDLVISFLHVPNMLSEICRISLSSRFKLIVSERNHDVGVPNFRMWARLLSHYCSNAVVANSHAQSGFLSQHAKWLKNRVSVITNCVDLEHFTPGSTLEASSNTTLRMAMIGRFVEQKNGLALAEGLALYEARRGTLPQIKIEWHGSDPAQESGIKNGIVQAIDRHQLQKVFFLNEPTKDVRSIYNQVDCLCLASLHEGCANVICEAMAFGLPVLASRAGDNDYLVKDGVNGLLLEGTTAQAIADGFKRFAKLGLQAREEMGLASRLRAEELLSPKRFGEEWLGLIGEVLGQ
jgi:glycosyltransferase involved in cell wall biosynthesis